MQQLAVGDAGARVAGSWYAHGAPARDPSGSTAVACGRAGVVDLAADGRSLCWVTQPDQSVHRWDW